MSTAEEFSTSMAAMKSLVRNPPPDDGAHRCHSAWVTSFSFEGGWRSGPEVHCFTCRRTWQIPPPVESAA